MMKASFFVFLAFCVVFGNSLEVKKCFDRSKTVDGVTIGDCQEEPCILKRSSTVAMEQVFTAEFDAEKVVTRVEVKIIPIIDYWTKYKDLNNKDACSKIVEKANGKPGCPLKKGVEYVYRNELTMLSWYPRINDFPIRWGLKSGEDNDGNEIFMTCFTVRATLGK